LNLLQNPLWRPDDLGRPIPDAPHAVSVCLPTWADNVGYEEQDPRVHDRLRAGYPRFVFHPLCRELFARCRDQFARDEACLAFPSVAAAERFAAHFRKLTGHPPRLRALGLHDVQVVCFPQSHTKTAKALWQHCGEGVSSRLAEACLQHRPIVDSIEAKQTVRRRLARLIGAAAEDVFLFSSGMQAIFTLFRVLGEMFPDRRSAQFGFPYVDTLKIQEKFGRGVQFYPRSDADELRQLEALLRREPISALYTEFPSNPMLVSPDLERLSDLSRRHAFPLIVDDTLACLTNADVFAVADVLTTSLTKFFSGVGDVTAGSVALNPRGPFYGELSSRLRQEPDDAIWCEDAVALERNSRDAAERLPAINANAEALAEYLAEHPRVERVLYPKFITTEPYRAFCRPGGGHGGLLSLTLRDPSSTPRFFDALRVSKGPNLGMHYTLACPFTILAHYEELDFAESCGVSRWLVRISVGVEDAEDLIDRFREALR
ncbi:MAG: PLP-dependent transferase, partial [Planctomycetaceae bacterium]